MGLYQVKVFAESDNDGRMALGTSTIEAKNKRAAQAEARDNHWDERLSCSSCRCSFETVKVPRYLVSDGWSHYFDNDVESTVRFVLDSKTVKITHMQIQVSDGNWTPASKEDCADVLESLQTANEDVFNSPEDFDAKGSETLPAWATAH
jgi:hypothetical protein